jgi:SAM-dependent methyltransferase
MEATGYLFPTGLAGQERLRIVEATLAETTGALLERAGIGAGMAVADIGCGLGGVTAWMAGRVGPDGRVVGVDFAAGQVELARERVGGLANVELVVADAHAPGLEAGAFDLVFCRVLLMHLARPDEALRAMVGLLKPGGRLVCEESDFGRWFAEPPVAAVDRYRDLMIELASRRGQDWCVGRRLPGMFIAAGIPEPKLSLFQPAYLSGDAKRLPGINLRETGPALIAAGLTDEAEVADLLRDLDALAERDGALLGMSLMVQTWGRRGPPAEPSGPET